MAKPLPTPDSILDGALQLLAREGADNLSVRKLAAHLHCSPNTLYQQIGNRDELIRQLLQRQFSAADNDFSPADTWQGTAHQWALALRRSLLSNPALTRLMTVEHRELVLKDVNTLMKTLVDQGVKKPLALNACRVLTHVVFGLCFTELQTPDSYRKTRRERDGSVALDDLVISETTPGDAVPAVFEQAVRWTLAGITADLR